MMDVMKAESRSFGWLRTYFGELLDPATYKRLVYLLLSFPLGILYFVGIIAGLSVGAGTFVIVAGAFVLLGTLWFVLAGANLERSLGSALLGVPLERPKPLVRTSNWWEWARVTLSDAGTYKALLYLLLKFPFGIVSFVLTVVLLAATVCMMAAPLALTWGPRWSSPVWIETGAFSFTSFTLGALFIGGVALLVLSVTVLNLLARAWGALSFALLTTFGESVVAEREVKALQQGARSVAFSGDLEQTLRELLAHGVEATSAAGALVRRDEVVLTSHGLPEGAPEQLSVLHDLTTRPAIGHARLTRTELGTLALFTVGKDETLGELSVVFLDGREPSRREIEFWSAVADQASSAIGLDDLLRRTRTEASERERARMARELHDSVAQALYGIALGAKTARAQLQRDPAKASESLEYTVSLADGAASEMKALLFALRPDALEEGGLTPALARLAEALKARYKLDAVLEAPEEPQVSGDVKGALYRIAQEAAHNAVKHAKATNVRIRLDDDEGRLTLTIVDDGIGFDPSASRNGTLGLKSMKERAIAVGASFDVTSHLGAGTTVAVRLPGVVA
ncbi:sensor histidine kinase [Deinococcus yavapaiensis]|uniref:Signal transduction histidine kinase n=1 Tax=Deinococcus yavapaiensis KR-236 TaxID=694435 RepID=A0A318SSE9_9DEIO|nr:sensor histidine kinase [Deinococcus yavapaiensis]PYE55937.1 signal transduction histidine kinase [Deinococcus yavapaiensis KR-236]